MDINRRFAHGRNLGHSLSRNQGATALSLSDTLNERVFVHYAYFPAVYGDYLQSVLAMGSLQALSTAVAKSRTLRIWLQSASSAVSLYDEGTRNGAAYGSFAE